MENTKKFNLKPNNNRSCTDGCNETTARIDLWFDQRQQQYWQHWACCFTEHRWPGRLIDRHAVTEFNRFFSIFTRFREICKSITD